MKYSGTSALAIYGMLGTVAALLISVFSGVGQAVQPIVSENYGAGNLDRCWQAERLGLKTTIFLGIFCTAVCMVFPVTITGFFMQLTPEIITMAPYIVRVYGASFFALALNMYVIYYLQAILCEKMASVISVLRGVILNSGFLFLFPLIWGANGIWWAILTGETLVMILGVVYLRMQYKKYLEKVEK